MKRQIVAKWIRDMLPRKCMNCGATASLTYHHIVPVSRGGNDVPSNIAVLCPYCHANVHYEKGSEQGIGHGDLVRAGQMKAKARGVRLGKPPAYGEHIMQMIAAHSTNFAEGDWTEKEIMQACNVRSTAYYKYKRLLLDDMDAPTWAHRFPKPTLIRNTPLYEHVIIEARCWEKGE